MASASPELDDVDDDDVTDVDVDIDDDDAMAPRIAVSVAPIARTNDNRVGLSANTTHSFFRFSFNFFCLAYHRVHRCRQNCR